MSGAVSVRQILPSPPRHKQGRNGARLWRERSVSSASSVVQNAGFEFTTEVTENTEFVRAHRTIPNTCVIPGFRCAALHCTRDDAGGWGRCVAFGMTSVGRARDPGNLVTSRARLRAAGFGA